MKTIEPGMPFTSVSPATGSVAWNGRAATIAQVHDAVELVGKTWLGWRQTTAEQRFEIARRFADVATRRQQELATLISAETGKPRWESTAEAKLIAAKVNWSINAHQQRCEDRSLDLPQGTGRVHWESIGVMAVLGPFNFPAHLPNGHIVPALIAGNVVVFKPSELTPGCGELLAEFWQEAGLPDGVVQVLQGDRVIGGAMVDANVNGVLFTGSHTAGCAIHRQLAGRPEVMLALEMGGNSPLIVDDVTDIDAAAMTCVISAYITAGQRCTCARRLILPDGPHVDSLIARIRDLASSMVVGKPDAEPEPFMGPVISADAGQRVIAVQQTLLDGGAVAVLPCQAQPENSAFVRPGLIDVTNCQSRSDAEVFGPLLQLIRVADFDTAIVEANATEFGLAAGLISDDRSRFQRFRENIRAGVINWNQPTVGASGQLPFGGFGASGNHRPSGSAAVEYCSASSAGIESPTLSATSGGYPGLDLSQDK